MIYLVWLSPIIAVVSAMVLGRGSLTAACLGAAIAIIVAVTAAPSPLTGYQALIAAGEGLWLAWLVGLVILAGLFFREALPVRIGSTGDDGDSPRRRAFSACFLVGPFVECGTGFGVGQVASIAMLRRLSLPATQVALFALFSQTLVPWGAMANGTMIGSGLSGLSPKVLGLYSAFCTAPLLLLWLFFFWAMAARADLPTNVFGLIGELGWIVALCALLVLGNWAVGPEVGAMTALGPLIALRFWLHRRKSSDTFIHGIRLAVPYAILIIGLTATRSVNWLERPLGAVAVKPFLNAPAWLPLLHPGSWLLMVGFLNLVFTEPLIKLWRSAKRAWVGGRTSVLTIGVYLVIAKVMADAGLADALASALQKAAGPTAVVATPWLAGIFGFLTGSCNATNGLLMTSQVSLAKGIGFRVEWLAAIQNTAGAALTMLSPARVTMGCALVGDKSLERGIYRHAWPLGIAPLVVLAMASMALLVVRL